MAMAAEQHAGLVVDLRQGERLKLSTGITVELLHKSGQAARLRVVAPKEIQISRESDEARQSGAVDQLNP